MKKFMHRRALLLAGAVWLGVAAGPTLAGEPPAIEAGLGLYSKYVWRGYELSRDSLVLQPSLSLGYQGFSLEFWSNVDTDLHEDLRGADSSRFQLNETDITLAYGWSMGPAELSAGYIYYSLDNAPDSQEVFLSAELDSYLNPTLTVYREFVHAPGWYVNLGISLR